MSQVKLVKVSDSYLLIRSRDWIIMTAAVYACISLTYNEILTFHSKVQMKKVIAFEGPVNALEERQKATVTLTSSN